VFDFVPNQGLALASIHPGGDFDQVQAQTGFRLDRPEKPKVTEAPPQKVLELIHGPVKEKVGRVYPLFAAEL
jgi:hypothetical protein